MGLYDIYFNVTGLCDVHLQLQLFMLEHDNYIINEVGVNNDFLPLRFERLERINDCIHYYYCLYTVAFINCFLIFEFKIKIAI